MKSEPEGTIYIGFGNPLCGDDGAGPCAAAELRGRGCNAIAVHQLTPELAEPLAKACTAVFIDADASLAPGEVRVRDSGPCPEGVFEHHVSPPCLVRLAREIYGHAPHAVLMGIGGANFDMHEGLSEAAMRGVAAVVDICMAPAGNR